MSTCQIPVITKWTSKIKRVKKFYWKSPRIGRICFQAPWSGQSVFDVTMT